MRLFTLCSQQMKIRCPMCEIRRQRVAKCCWTILHQQQVNNSPSTMGRLSSLLGVGIWFAFLLWLAPFPMTSTVGSPDRLAAQQAAVSAESVTQAVDTTRLPRQATDITAPIFHRFALSQVATSTETPAFKPTLVRVTPGHTTRPPGSPRVAPTDTTTVSVLPSFTSTGLTLYETAQLPPTASRGTPVSPTGSLTPSSSATLVATPSAVGTPGAQGTSPPTQRFTSTQVPALAVTQSSSLSTPLTQESGPTFQLSPVHTGTTLTSPSWTSTSFQRLAAGKPGVFGRLWLYGCLGLAYFTVFGLLLVYLLRPHE